MAIVTSGSESGQIFEPSTKDVPEEIVLNQQSWNAQVLQLIRDHKSMEELMDKDGVLP